MSARSSTCRASEQARIRCPSAPARPARRACPASSPQWSRCESSMTRTEATLPRLFGTDGVRGVAGRYPLDRATVQRLGAAFVRALPHAAESAKLLVGRDTRESGGWIEAALAHGASSEGAAVT